MANGDPLFNCAMHICCPPESKEAEKALVVVLINYGGLDEETARKAAPAVHKCFDLAPKGSLQPFKTAVAHLARGEDYTA